MIAVICYICSSEGAKSTWPHVAEIFRFAVAGVTKCAVAGQREWKMRDQTHTSWIVTLKSALSAKNSWMVLSKPSHALNQIFKSCYFGRDFFFFFSCANLQLQINSSCLHHPSAVSPFFLPLLQFPHSITAPLRFPASTSPSLSFHFQFSLLRAYVKTHGSK